MFRFWKRDKVKNYRRFSALVLSIMMLFSSAAEGGGSSAEAFGAGKAYPVGNASENTAVSKSGSTSKSTGSSDSTVITNTTGGSKSTAASKSTGSSGSTAASKSTGNSKGSSTSKNSSDPDYSEKGQNKQQQGRQQQDKKETIVGFAELKEEESNLYFSTDEKPSLNELEEMMPSKLKVYLKGRDDPVDIDVDWHSEGADYETSRNYYFQFSPDWDTVRYELSGEYDERRDAPYVSVFLQPLPDMDAVTAEHSLLTDSGDNESQIYNFLIVDMGLSIAGACGALANIRCESGFDPNALGDSGTSYGICQWHNTRWDRLKEFCASYGYDWTTLEGQLYYLEYELNLPSYWHIYEYLLSVENTSEGAYDAAYYWCYYFEVPSDRENASITRGNLAKNTYWNKYYDGSEEENDDVVVVSVNGISLDETSISLRAGRSRTLKATVTPSDASDKTVSWSSSNELVAKVDDEGVVTGVSEGSAVITASAGGGEFRAVCEVTVKSGEETVTGVYMAAKQKAIVNDYIDGYSASARFISSSKKTASVSKSGLIKARKPGVVTIYIYEGAELFGTVEINVVKPSISAKKLITGLEEEFNANDNISGAGQLEAPSWTSSRTDVASVDLETGEITPYKTGKTKLTAYFGEGAFAAKLKFRLQVVQ